MFTFGEVKIWYFSFRPYCFVIYRYIANERSYLLMLFYIYFSLQPLHEFLYDDTHFFFYIRVLIKSKENAGLLF